MEQNEQIFIFQLVFGWKEKAANIYLEEFNIKY